MPKLLPGLIVASRPKKTKKPILSNPKTFWTFISVPFRGGLGRKYIKIWPNSLSKKTRKDYLWPKLVAVGPPEFIGQKIFLPFFKDILHNFLPPDNSVIPNTHLSNYSVGPLWMEIYTSGRVWMITLIICKTLPKFKAFRVIPTCPPPRPQLPSWPSSLTCCERSWPAGDNPPSACSAQKRRPLASRYTEPPCNIIGLHNMDSAKGKSDLLVHDIHTVPPCNIIGGNNRDSTNRKSDLQLHRKPVSFLHHHIIH